MELVLEVVSRAAGSRSLRAAGLCHEPLNDAVEHDAVVELFARQLLDVVDMTGRQIGAHLDDDFAFGRLQDQGVFGISHSDWCPVQVSVCTCRVT